MSDLNPVMAFLSRNKMELAILVGITATAALKYKSIFVPDCIQDPSAYKASVISFGVMKLAAKAANSLKLGNEATVFRSIANFLLSKSVLAPKARKALKARFVQVEIRCVKVGETPVRLYSRKASDNQKRPIMMFFHGGAYVIGQAALYDSFLCGLVETLDIVVAAVDYKLAPENAFPAPLDDCQVTTKSLLGNLEAFNLSNIDLDRVVLSGESAGANIATALAKRFKKEASNFTVKLQVLIYPPTQYFNFILPSSIRFSSLEIAYSRAKFALWHTGIMNVDSVLDDLVLANTHLSILSPPELDKYRDLVNVSSIDDQHKLEHRLDYDTYSVLSDRVYPNFQDGGLGQRNASKLQQLVDKDPGLRQKLLNLVHPDFSVLLADDSDLRALPPAYFVICGQDSRKDEGLIYAKRLEKLNNNVRVDYFEQAIHGSLIMNTSVSKTMRLNIQNYLFEQNLTKSQ